MSDTDRPFANFVVTDYEDETFERLDSNHAAAHDDPRAALLLEAFLQLDSAQYHGMRMDKGGLALDILARLDAMSKES